MILKSDKLIDNPLVSVVVTSMNRANTICQTIDSILNQKCDFDFEIIVGDDGSSDNSRDILKNYLSNNEDRFVLLFQESNLGLGGNWATCVKYARGKYIATCDDDDYWHNDQKLQIQVDYLENNSETVMVHTEINNLYAVSNKIISNFNSKKRIFVKQGYIQKDIFCGNVPVCVSSSLIKKEIINKYINLDDYVKYRFGIQDWPTWIIISNYGKIDYIPVSTCTYRIGHFAISNLNNYEKQLNKMAQDKIMYKYLCGLFPENLKYDESDFDRHTYNILLNLAYKKLDFRQAHIYRELLINISDKNHKIQYASNYITFYIYAVLLNLKRNIRVL